MNDTPLAERQARLQQRILAAVHAAGRRPEDVHLLAVSKHQPVDSLRTLYTLGQRHFGENYVQEALAKQQELSDLSELVWHFIGPLQRNKTAWVAEHFSWVHSLDRLILAQRLSDQRGEDLPPLQVCLQVNISAEASKSGCSVAALPELAAAVAALPRLQLRGLMALPAPGDDDAFRRLAAAQAELVHCGHALDTLSMGMSDDLEAAIAAGANWVRIGSALFGPRKA